LKDKRGLPHQAVPAVIHTSHSFRFFIQANYFFVPTIDPDIELGKLACDAVGVVVSEPFGESAKPFDTSCAAITV
jgi:hypothetical protein